MKLREHYIDVAKGIAMLLVIIGHITIIPSWLYAWINSFHMPLFFFYYSIFFLVSNNYILGKNYV